MIGLWLLDPLEENVGGAAGKVWQWPKAFRRWWLKVPMVMTRGGAWLMLVSGLRLIWGHRLTRGRHQGESRGKLMMVEGWDSGDKRIEWWMGGRWAYKKEVAVRGPEWEVG